VPSVHVSHLTFSYTSAVPVLDDVSFDLGPGWAALVGGNGAGKTTLLRLVAGDLPSPPDAVRVVPSGAVVVTCPQRVDAPDDRVIALARSWESPAARLRGLLELDVADVERWEMFSPGQRKRWQVGGALAVDPDVLLLDEPTNHLDAHARDLLATALREFRGIGVLVSHDRALLDELAATTLRLSGHTIEVWGGGYQAAKEAWEAAEAEQREARSKAARERRKAARLLDRAARNRASAEAGMKRAQRTAGIKDADARGAAQTGRRAGAEARLGREVAVRKAALERADKRLASSRVEDALGGDIRFPFEPAPKEWLARLDLDRLEAGGRRLSGPIRVGVRRSDRIRLTGRNGAGKTTLLRQLIEALAVPVERVTYLAQEFAAQEGRHIWQSVRSAGSEELGRLLSLVAVLGVDPDRLLASDEPSPGEVRKLVMARGLAAGSWLLILDEPTNHLDLPSIERLERALVSYPGAVVMVTHDDALADAVTRSRWHLEGGQFSEEA
jgi:ATPase subunit of ABC transporter with duplicated ATPase domains